MKLTTNQISKIDGIININNQRKIVVIDESGSKTIKPGERSANVYCINQENEIIWQVKDMEKRPFDDDMFVYIKMNEKGEITGNRFSGFRYKINPETGDAEIDGFDK